MLAENLCNLILVLLELLHLLKALRMLYNEVGHVEVIASSLGRKVVFIKSLAQNALTSLNGINQNMQHTK